MKQYFLLLIILTLLVNCTQKVKLSSLKKEIITFEELPLEVQHQAITLLTKDGAVSGVATNPFVDLDSLKNESFYWQDTIPSSGKSWSRIVYKRQYEVIIDISHLKCSDPYIIKDNRLYYRVNPVIWNIEMIKDSKYGKVDLMDLQ